MIDFDIVETKESNKIFIVMWKWKITFFGH
jgi:hypothetical protein